MKAKSFVKVMQASLLAGVMLVGLAACGKTEEPAAPAEPTVTEQPAATETTETVAEPEPEPEPEPAAAQMLEMDGTRSYLSGLEIGSELANKRPAAVMYENTEACLPHHNLDKAQIIYECPVEGGITRYMAIFDEWEDLYPVGNVRSCRTYYAVYATEYDGIYFHWGEAPFAKEFLTSGLVDDVDALSYTWNGKANHAAGAYFFRLGGTGEHTGYTSGENMKKAIAALGYRTEYNPDHEAHWNFAADGTKVTLDEGEDVQVIKLYYTYNSPYFIYNTEDGKYYRYQFGGKECDGESGAQYAVDNIIFQNAPNDMYVDGNGATKYLNFYLEGQGAGKYFTNGKMVDVMWRKDTQTGVTHFYNADGTDLIINQGKTWYCLIQTPYADSNTFYATEADFH